MYQWVAVEDASEMDEVFDAVRRSMGQIIEEEQAHRVQVAAVSQMQLQAMEWVDAQEKELQRLSVLLVEHQALYSPCQKGPTKKLCKLHPRI